MECIERFVKAHLKGIFATLCIIRLSKSNDFAHVENKRPGMIASRMLEGHTITYGGENILVREGDSLTGFIYTSDPAPVFASRNVRNRPNRSILTR